MQRARGIRSVVLVVVGVLIIWAAPAGAKNVGPLEIGSTTVVAGESVTVSGDGCVAGAQVELSFDETLVVDAEADADGGFTAVVEIPEAAAAASHEITALCGTAEGDSIFLTGTVTVELASTGADSRSLATIGLAFLGVGLLLVLVASGRRRTVPIA